MTNTIRIASLLGLFGLVSATAMCTVTSGPSDFDDDAASSSSSNNSSNNNSSSTTSNMGWGGEGGTSTSTNTGAGGEGGSSTSTNTGGGVPQDWACDPSFYGDSECDCGCGVQDIDCPDNNIESCQACSGCAMQADCSDLDPNDPTTCIGSSGGSCENECANTACNGSPADNTCFACVQTNCQSELAACFNTGTDPNCTTCNAFFSMGENGTLCPSSEDEFNALGECTCGS